MMFHYLISVVQNTDTSRIYGYSSFTKKSDALHAWAHLCLMRGSWAELSQVDHLYRNNYPSLKGREFVLDQYEN